MQMSDAIKRCAGGVAIMTFGHAQAGPTQSIGFTRFHADGSVSYSGPIDNDGSTTTCEPDGDFEEAATSTSQTCEFFCRHGATAKMRIAQRT
jgi:hypothetical protein